MNFLIKATFFMLTLSAGVIFIGTYAESVENRYTHIEIANELAQIGLIEDYSQNPSSYRLDETISREELAKLIVAIDYVSLGLKMTGGNSIYQDMDFAPWSEKYAKILNEAGYAASNKYFYPKRNVSKIEALKWVIKTLGIESGEGKTWQEARINGAIDANFTSYFSDYDSDATRAQVFIWIADALVYYENDTCLDDDYIAYRGECIKNPTH